MWARFCHSQRSLYDANVCSLECCTPAIQNYNWERSTQSSYLVVCVLCWRNNHCSNIWRRVKNSPSPRNLHLHVMVTWWWPKSGWRQETNLSKHYLQQGMCKGTISICMSLFKCILLTLESCHIDREITTWVKLQFEFHPLSSRFAIKLSKPAGIWYIAAVTV